MGIASSCFPGRITVSTAFSMRQIGLGPVMKPAASTTLPSGMGCVLGVVTSTAALPSCKIRRWPGCQKVTTPVMRRREQEKPATSYGRREAMESLGAFSTGVLARSTFTSSTRSVTSTAPDISARLLCREMSVPLTSICVSSNSCSGGNAALGTRTVSRPLEFTSRSTRISPVL